MTDYDFESLYKPQEGDSAFESAQKERLKNAFDELSHEPDWTAFKEYLKNKITDMDKLTPYILKYGYPFPSPNPHIIVKPPKTAQLRQKNSNCPNFGTPPVV